MQKISIYIHQSMVDTVIQTIHETGVAEIIDISHENPALLDETQRGDMHPEAGTCAEYELRLTRLIDILKKTQKKPSGIQAVVHPEKPKKTVVESHSIDELYSYAESILHDIERTCLDADEQEQDLQAHIQHIDEDLQQLQMLTSFDFNIQDLGLSAYLYIISGKTAELPTLKNALDATITDYVLQSKQYGSGKKKEWAVLIAVHRDQQTQLDKIGREHLSLFWFKEEYKGTPTAVIQKLENRKNKLNTQIENIQKKLSDYAGIHLQELFALREEIHLERIRKEIPKHFVKTTHTYLIQAWVPSQYEEQLHQAIEKTTQGSYIFESEKPSMNPDNPPTYLDTPKWAQSFRTFLELFATPRYNELNPTIPMGLFFILFFGFMLGDGGYGLVILLLSLFGYIKFGKTSAMLRDWSFLGIWLGMVTTTAGFLMNSFFGDLIPRFFYGNPEQPLYQLTIFGIQLPLEPLSDPLTILTLALVCGLIHLNLGILLGILQAAHQKKYKALITQHFTWIPLQVGGGLLIGSMILDWQISSILFYAASWLTLIGVLLLFINEGPIGFFAITGYIGDWLSYARLLALGLATAGMALAFNVVGELIPELIPVVGIVFLPIILVFAHLANLVIQALGAGVHSLRLQYVEFFNRFYQGGGRPYTPFRIKRKYTIMEKEKI